MAIKFGTDGTIYCNTVRYNYKQARNMIADGSYGNISSSSVWANVVASTSPTGYKSYRCFKVTTANATQKLPALYSGHKYYFSCRYQTSSTSASIVLRNNGSDISGASLYVGTSPSTFILSSTVVTMTTNIATGVGDVCIWNGDTSNPVYVSRFILVDLTDTFGSGNEPTKAWCDNNIREQEVICNFGNISNNVNYSNISTRYTGSQLSERAYFNYLQLDSYWEPRDYMYYLQGSASYNEGYLTSASSFTLNNTYTYYAYVDQHTEQVSGVRQSSDFYFPVAEPFLERIILVEETGFNGGGGMRDWKRVSAFNTRTSFTDGSYQSRFDFNNKKQTNVLRLTAFNIVNVSSYVTRYNTYNGTSITISDVNKEWCDRWIDGRSSPIIHIKDPGNKTIKFNTDYDIVCNDIEIRPELSKIILDGNTGTIKCHKLVRTQAY